MVTALEACNHILLNASDRAWASFDGKPPIQKARQALVTALMHVAGLSEWRCLIKESNFPDALSWDFDAVTIPDFGSLIEVYQITSAQRHSLDVIWCPTYAEYRRQADYMTLQPFSDNCHYPAIVGVSSSKVLRVNPYPATADDRESLYFMYYRGFNYEFTAEDDDLNVPVELESLVYTYGGMQLAHILTHDVNIAGSLQAAYLAARDAALNNNAHIKRGNRYGN